MKKGLSYLRSPRGGVRSSSNSDGAGASNRGSGSSRGSWRVAVATAAAGGANRSGAEGTSGDRL